MKSAESQREPGRTESASAGVLLIVPLFLCCGLPLLLVAGGGLVAWAGLHGVLLGAIAAVVVGGVAVAVWRTRHGAASACVVCESGFQKEGGFDAGPAHDQRHALS